jgi:NADPH:quinone reductase-like Zn-dependent oxidoreductase
MRAVTVSDYGKAPVLSNLPKPEPGPGQVLIRVQAAGMNPLDRLIASGGWKSQMPATFPLVLGADVAGVVDAVGPDKTTFQPGDEVTADVLRRVADAVAKGRIVPPPITRITLADVPAVLNKPVGQADGKTVVTP